MTEAQKKKTKFRKSAKWLKFRHYINVKQRGLCYISHKKLLKGATLHHCDLNEKHYEDLSKPENFVFLNKSLHEVVHTLWRYYKDDPDVITRLVEVLERMKQINNNKEEINEK